jgi:hypothetical protein
MERSSWFRGIVKEDALLSPRLALSEELKGAPGQRMKGVGDRKDLRVIQVIGCSWPLTRKAQWKGTSTASSCSNVRCMGGQDSPCCVDACWLSTVSLPDAHQPCSTQSVQEPLMRSMGKRAVDCFGPNGADVAYYASAAKEQDHLRVSASTLTS